MEKTLTKTALVDCHAEPFKGSKVAGMQVYLVVLFVAVALAVAINTLMAQ